MIYRFLPMETEYCEKVFSLEKEIFSDFYSLESIVSDSINPKKISFVLVDDNNIVVSYSMLSTVLDEANIDRIAVKESARKNGIGSQMLSNVIDYCKNNNINIINLEVRSSNVAGHKLYEKFGFIKVGERKKYYSDNNEDAYLYTLNIEG